MEVLANKKRGLGTDAHPSYLSLIASVADEHKAEDIIVLDLRGLTSFTDYFVVCGGLSDRHVSSIAEAIRENVKKSGHVPLNCEGINSGNWALIDCGDVVVHVFHKNMREYYQLEKLWHDAPRIKL